MFNLIDNLDELLEGLAKGTILPEYQVAIRDISMTLYRANKIMGEYAEDEKENEGNVIAALRGEIDELEEVMHNNDFGGTAEHLSELIGHCFTWAAHRKTNIAAGLIYIALKYLTKVPAEHRKYCATGEKTNE